jgi:hypothetical protein
MSFSDILPKYSVEVRAQFTPKFERPSEWCLCVNCDLGSGPDGYIDEQEVQMSIPELLKIQELTDLFTLPSDVDTHYCRDGKKYWARYL